MPYYSIFYRSGHSIDDEIIEAKSSRDALQKYFDACGKNLIFERCPKSEEFDYTVTPMENTNNDNTNGKVGDNIRYKITGGSDYKPKTPPLNIYQKLAIKRKNEREQNKMP